VSSHYTILQSKVFRAAIIHCFWLFEINVCFTLMFLLTLLNRFLVGFLENNMTLWSDKPVKKLYVFINLSGLLQNTRSIKVLKQLVILVESLIICVNPKLSVISFCHFCCPNLHLSLPLQKPHY